MLTQLLLNYWFFFYILDLRVLSAGTILHFKLELQENGRFKFLRSLVPFRGVEGHSGRFAGILGRPRPFTAIYGHSGAKGRIQGRKEVIGGWQYSKTCQQICTNHGVTILSSHFVFDIYKSFWCFLRHVYRMHHAGCHCKVNFQWACLYKCCLPGKVSGRIIFHCIPLTFYTCIAAQQSLHFIPWPKVENVE